MNKHIVVDCEASGPCPQFGSMINFGAFVVESTLDCGFRSEVIRPYSDNYHPDAYRSIGLTYDQHLATATCDLVDAISGFATWLNELGANRVIFWSDNPAFDWQWINHGFAAAGLPNPFGFSARRIGDLYAGLKRSPANTQGWKKLRKTDHDHDPLNDAKGNAEALLALLAEQQLDGWLK